MKDGRFHGTMTVIALAVAGFSVYGTLANRITVSFAQMLPLCGLLAALLAGVAFYRWRRETRITNLLLVVFWAVLITNLHMFPMFIAARQKVALADGLLASADRALGLEVPAVLDFMGQHRGLGKFLDVCYCLLTTLLTLAVMALPLCRRMDLAKEFLVGVTIAAIVGMSLFACFQAVGPWDYYGYPPSADQEGATKVFLELKTDNEYLLNLSYAEGLISFPSFHTILAILPALALRSNRWLRWPAAILAALIVVSTITTGWHYVIDTLGGIAVAAISFAGARGYLWLESRERWWPDCRSAMERIEEQRHTPLEAVTST